MSEAAVGRALRPVSGARYISREGGLLFLLCLLDTLSSAYLFHHQLAVEANPLLRAFADQGVAPFVWVKLATFVPPIALLELFRRRRPDFIEGLLRTAVVAYATIYVVPAAAQLAR